MVESFFTSIISVENLLGAWREFLPGKSKRKDAQEFQLHLMDALLDLHTDLKNKTYIHGGYEAFSINDPKPRDIHKAPIRDRLLHHAVYRVLYPYFDKKFVFDSYSCRLQKGTHRALERFQTFIRKVSQNNTKQCWILKCDVRKFFASIDQKTLIETIGKYVGDTDTVWLLERIVESFYSTELGKGLPLGNLTSQLLVNIYMNWFDQYMKHQIKAQYYIRYADDFVVMSRDEEELDSMLLQIKFFLLDTLKLTLHPDKVFIKTLASGVDFLGWVHFPDHRVLRTTTKRRMIKNLQQSKTENRKQNAQNYAQPEIVQSYLGLLSHGNTEKIRSEIQREFLEQ